MTDVADYEGTVAFVPCLNLLFEQWLLFFRVKCIRLTAVGEVYAARTTTLLSGSPRRQTGHLVLHEGRSDIDCLARVVVMALGNPGPVD